MREDKDYKVAAWVTIKHAADMTEQGRERIAAWLRRQADALEDEGTRYSARFVGRYWYKVRPTDV